MKHKILIASWYFQTINKKNHCAFWPRVASLMYVQFPHTHQNIYLYNTDRDKSIVHIITALSHVQHTCIPKKYTHPPVFGWFCYRLIYPHPPYTFKPSSIYNCSFHAMNCMWYLWNAIIMTTFCHSVVTTLCFNNYSEQYVWVKYSLKPTSVFPSK